MSGQLEEYLLRFIKAVQPLDSSRHDRHLRLTLDGEARWIRCQHMLALECDLRGVKPS